MLIFDTKGFLRSFYQPGDIVNSNDEKATVLTVKIWNIFEENQRRSQYREEIVEITRALYFERATINQPISQMPPETCLQGNAAFLSYGGVKNNAVLRRFLDQTPAAENRAVLSRHQI
jgi:hypothetical protein